MILSSMKEIAEAYLGEKVTHAVVTVPAWFNDAQRQATKDAGTIAGLTILRLMNDPTAAALAYGVHQNNAPGSKIIVYDLGGGTFDVSLLLVKEDGVFEVLATAGDARLGGEDFDERVMRYLVEAHTSRTGRDVSDDSAAMNRLKMEVEKAKIILSRKPSAIIKIENFGDGDRLVETLTRDQFEELNSDLFDQTMTSVDRVLIDAGTTKDEVDEVVLVGGSSKIPKVRQLLRDHFGKEPSKLHSGLVNPDAAVVYGGAVHGAVLGAHKLKKKMVLNDVATLSLGIDTYGGWFAPLIPRNTAIPATRSQIFTTVVDYQTSVTIAVYEGEHERSKNNHLLGDFELTGIFIAPRNVPHIEVTFRIDGSGILGVTAADKRTRSSGSITITNHNRSRLSEEEILRMRRNAGGFS
ncbi:ATPase with role in protein import into the ER [Marasmius tenuissimus]|nr:ATPase with role in protein import into the ER [Marasmius tenuissimus]